MRSAVLAVVVALLPACVDAPSEDGKAGDGLVDDGTGEGGGKEDSYGFSGRTCADGVTTFGVDVSYHQGKIDWDRAKAAGVEFALIRLSDGKSFRDPKFATNWAGAQAAGIIRGAYQFFRPAQSATAQADMMIAAIGTHVPGDLPPVIDVEVTGGLAAAQIAAGVRTWVDRVQGALGVTPIVYSGSYFWRDQVGGAKAFASNPLWIAQFTTRCPNLPLPWTRWDFWQYSDRGSIAGIGTVDLDRFNGSVEDLRAFALAQQSVSLPAPARWSQAERGGELPDDQELLRR